MNLSLEAKFNLRGFSNADGILGRILSTRGNVKKIEKVGTKEILFVVADGNGNFSHGKTIKEAQDDLVYKVTASFDGNLPESATVSDWIGIYRAATGACSQGVKMFVQEKDIALDVVKTAKEIASEVEGRYGAEKFIALVNGVKQ